MTAKSTVKSKKKNPPAVEAAPSPNNETTPEVTSLEKVRDILFGEEVQRLSQRQEQINNQLAQQIDDLKKETFDQIKALEQGLSQKLDTLGAQLDTEEKHRAGEVNGLQKELSDTIASLDAQVKNGLADLYDQLMGECNRLQSESDKLAERLRQSSEDLGDAKADRSTLANLLKEMASNLDGGQ